MERQGKTSGFSLKSLSKQQWLALVLLGLLLVVIALPTASKKTSETSGLATEKSMLSEEDSLQVSGLEQKLQYVLAQTEGVGEVKVMLNISQENAGFSSFSEGEGQQKIQGALIVAEGADNSVTIQKIQEAVMALFQVEAHKIKVMKMK